MRRLLNGLFFASGISSLIYQVVWQRKLFAIFGLTIEATTVVVSVFMAGLGLGALCGGWIAKRIKRTHLLIFGAVELLIGIFGMISLPIITFMAQAFAGSNLLTTTFTAFLFLIIPTLLMGLSLPLLIAFVNRQYHDVGFSSGTLYFINTLGAATGTILSGFVLIELFGLNGAVIIACSINLFVGFLSLFSYFRHGDEKQAQADNGGRQISNHTGFRQRIDKKITISVMISFAFGFLALSYEMVLFRIGVFVFHDLAYTFPGVLAPYLFGIALGSQFIKKWCSKLGNNIIFITICLELVIGFYLLATIPAFSKLADVVSVPNVLSLPNILVMASFAFFIVIIPAVLMGTTFPLLCHHAVERDIDTGPYTSYIYFSNTIGSTLGSLIAGFYLIGTFGLYHTLIILSALATTMFILTVLIIKDITAKKPKIIGAMVSVLAVLLISYPVSDHIYEHLFHYRQPLEKNSRIVLTQESKYGVTIVTENAQTGIKTMFGNGVYDAHATMTLPSGNERALIPVLLRSPSKEIFQIGLGTGAWTKILATIPGVEKITVVEINDASVDLLNKIPEVRSILTNPKVEIIIDDGRRWLNAHPERRFNFFCFNATIHDTNLVGNLLSYDFNNIVKKHMDRNAVVLLNPTYGPDVYRTFTASFPYVNIFPHLRGVIIGSLEPFEFKSHKEIVGMLADMRTSEGNLLELTNPRHCDLIQSMLEDIASPENRDKHQFVMAKSRIITDDYLPNEYNLFHHLFYGPNLQK
jgi:predicted membrane-bound spermidine synthase